MVDGRLIGEVVLSQTERIKVSVGERDGHTLVDLRVFAQGDTAGVHDQATGRGFALPRESVLALVSLLQAAARRR